MNTGDVRRLLACSAVGDGFPKGNYGGLSRLDEDAGTLMSGYACEAMREAANPAERRSFFSYPFWMYILPTAPERWDQGQAHRRCYLPAYVLYERVSGQSRAPLCKQALPGGF